MYYRETSRFTAGSIGELASSVLRCPAFRLAWREDGCVAGQGGSPISPSTHFSARTSDTIHDLFHDLSPGFTYLLIRPDPTTMSFVFEWDKLDDEVALQIEGLIHAHFQRIQKPSFMGNIAVSKFRLGSTPPSITVLDITDPLEEWYVHMDQEEARLAQEAAEAGGGESMDEDELASGDEYDDYSYSDGSIGVEADRDDMGYLEPGIFQDNEQQQSEDWFHHQHPGQRRVGSNSGDSYREEVSSGPASRKPNSRNGEAASDQDPFGLADRHHPFKTTVASRSSPSSSTSSSSDSSYDQSTSQSDRYHEEDNEEAPHTRTSKSNRRRLKLEIDGLPDTSASETRSTTHSLSSHTSDDEIESEAFYTQGGSTVYQRMMNLVIDPSNQSPRKPASAEGEAPSKPPHHPQLGASLFPASSGTTSAGLSNGVGLGFGGGIGSSPGSVLSTVLQNRTASRPLASGSFYSSPTSPSAPGQSSQIHFPDLAGMVVSGNSLLGLRAGTPSRTIPSTPRGFESPTLAYSRRQSFSDPGADDSQTVSVSYRQEPPINELHNKDQDSSQSTTFASPVEALSLDAFSQRPKVVERLADAEAATYDHEHDPQSRRPTQRDQRSRSSSIRHHDRPAARPVRHDRHTESRRRKRRGEGRSEDRYDRGGPSPVYSPSPTPPKRHENDIQLLLAVQYQGQMGFTVETELLLNYPTFAFLALPVKLVITGFSLKGKLLMGYLRDHVNVCFLEPEDANESILSDVRIESQVGDEQKQAVLKNVGKIERFVLEQLRKFITEDMVYPSYHSIELVRATPPTPMPQPGNQAAGPRGISSAHPPVDTSVATTHHTNSANVRSSRAPSTSTSTTPSIHSGIGRTQSSNLDYRRH